MHSIVKKINIFRTILLSFYSKNLYNEVAYERTGYGLFYLFFIMALWSVVDTYLLYQKHPISKVISAIINTNQLIPTITIHQGKVSVNKLTPYLINNSKNEPIIILDMTGKYNSLDDMSSVNVLYTKNDIYYRDINKIKHIPVTQYSGEDLITYDKITFIAGLSMMVVPLLIVHFIFSLGIFFIIFSITAYIASLKLKNKINFDLKTRMRLAITAYTPALIIVMIIQSMNLITNYGLLALIAYILYSQFTSKYFLARVS